MKKTGKLITLILVVAMALSLMSVAALADSSKTYKDVVAGKWYVQYVDYVVENGLMSGMSEDTFAPNTAVNRAMFIQTLYALAEKPEVDVTDPFNDLAEGAYYENAANWAKEKGVASGMGDNTFAPNKEITRQEAATFFQAYAEKVAGADVSDASGMNKYPDADKVAKWAKNAMGWAVKNNIVSGSKDNGTIVLAPERGLTRAELAAMLKAFDKYLDGLKPVVVPDKIGYGTVEVVVTASDKAVAGVTFALTGNDNDENVIELTATTNEKGVATFDRVPASNKDGYSVVATNADARYGKQTAVTGVAVEPEKTTTVEYALKEQGGNVTVVVDASKEAEAARALLDGVVVRLEGTTYDGQRYARELFTELNKDTKKGEATFKNVPAGKYTVAEIWEEEGDQAGNDTYNRLQERYGAPTQVLLAEGQSFDVENSDVTVNQTLKIYDPTGYGFIEASVEATNEEFFKTLAGYQFQVTGVSKDGEEINVASNYTIANGKVRIKVPETKVGTQYTVTLLNAPSYVTVAPKSVKVFVADEAIVPADFELTMKTSSVEVKLVDIDTKEVVRDMNAPVNVYGKTADGAKYEISAVDSDNDGFATFEGIPYSDANGYDIYVEGDVYAIAKTANVVVDSEEEKDIDVYVTKKWGAVDVNLSLQQKDKSGKLADVDASGYKFKLVGKTSYGDELSMTSLDETDENGDVTFGKVPFGVYKIYAIGLDDAESLTVRVWNEVAMDDSATTNNTVIVDEKNKENVRVEVKGILKVSPKVVVHYMYRDVEITGINTELRNIDTDEVFDVVKSGVKGAEFKFVPAGTYQVTMINDADPDSPNYVLDMYEYEVIQGQNTIVEVSNKAVDVYINLSRTPAPGATK